MNESEEVKPLNKLEILLLNNGWNSSNEKLITKIGDNCRVFRNLHIAASEYYQNVDKGLKISLLVCGVLLSTDSIFGVLGTVYLVILQKIVIFITAFISAINNFLKSSELAEKHIQASKEFLIISNDIRSIMCVYKKDRMNSVKYIKLLTNRYDNLKDNSPKIPNRYLKNFSSFLGNKDYFDIQLTDILDTSTESIEVQPQSTESIVNEPIRNIFKTETGDLQEDDTIIIENIKNIDRTFERKMQYELDRFKFHQS